jgi:GNAT superfamily N-acetyltransferase
VQAVAAVLLRRVRSREELIATFDAIGRQCDPRFAAPDRRLDESLGHFPEDRALMLTLLVDAESVGGVIAFQNGSAVVVRAIGVDAEWRGRGLARRLLEIVEMEAMALGSHGIVLGAAEDARGFYDRLGYRGKHTMRHKEFPRPGRLTDLRVRKTRASVGDLDTGVEL